MTLLGLFLLLMAGMQPGYAQITLSLPEVRGDVGTTLTIPVTVSDLTGKDVLGYSFTVRYDPAVLKITGHDQSGTRSEGTLATGNDKTVGEYRIAGASGSPLTGSGTFIKLNAQVVGTGTTALEWKDVRFESNSGVVATQTTNGSFTTDRPANQPPKGDNQNVIVNEDTMVKITLTGSDPEGTSLTFAILSPPNKGTLKNLTKVNATSATVEYTPNKDFFGGDLFTFTVNDGEFTSSGVVDISVIQVNDPPVANADSYSVNEDETLTVPENLGVLANDTDIDGGHLTASLVTNVKNGTLDLKANGSFTYTPKKDFNGIDTFVYSVNDTHPNGSATATVTITVVPVEDAPSLSEITAPADGTTIVIGGQSQPRSGNEKLVDVTWTASTDPEGAQVTYEYQIAADAGFNQILHTQAFGTATSFSLTVAQLAVLFDQFTNKGAPGTSLKVYHRIVASDGSLKANGNARSVTLVRGLITSLEETVALPEAFALEGNYPNPFNPTTTIRMDLPEAAVVRVELYDVLGRRVFAAPASQLNAGHNVSLQLDATSLMSGTYVYRVTAAMASRTVVGTGRMTLLK